MDRLISAEKLKQHYAWWENGTAEMTLAEAKKNFDTIIDVQPTVDAEPVVRCDDCIYRDGKTPGQPNILCWQMHADDFCSYGTKREVGTYCKDIVTVVRCKDCKYYDGEYRCCATDIWTNPNGYCHYGERKEND